MNNIKQYHPASDYFIVEEAYKLASEAHKDQYRKSGEPYIIHPLYVSIILSQLQLDLESIAAGLLHDVIEDTLYSYKEIEDKFGEDVAQLVDGVTKLENLQYISKMEAQAENFRKMFLAMAKDIRVILIKIADRLHNMRTLKYQPEAKQLEVAQETLDIYAPLTHRLGISLLRYELEDLCFKYLHPDEYKDLTDKINRKLSERMAFVERIVEEIKINLLSKGMDVDVVGRPKHFFSIYKKMVSQNKTLDQLFDLIAVRVIVNSVPECYQVLGVLHESYKPMPGRFKDYIGMPKTNRYQSLHTTLLDHSGVPFEVQIRTHDMHRTAEYGIAAHWKYKEGKTDQSQKDSEEAKLTWLREILQWQHDLSNNSEFMDALKLDLSIFKEHVYCFTPQGEVVSLINGATTIDFAYAIHSALGNRMSGAKANGKMVPIEYVLENGDRVEILTSNNIKGPNPNWLKIVKTTTARSKINSWFKKYNREENILKGKELLEKEAKRKDAILDVILIPDGKKAVLSRFSYQDWDSLCAAVGHGGLKESSVITKLLEIYKIKKEEENKLDEIEISPGEVSGDRKKKSSILVKGIGDISVRFSKCCTPVPGDEIIGFVTRGRGVTIHRTDCVNVIKLDDDERNRLIEAQWQDTASGKNGRHYLVELRIVGEERLGFIHDISSVVRDERISVKDMSAKTTRGDAIITLSLEITSREQLEVIIDKLRKVTGTYEVERSH
jgi:GTP pyrophosphokinase